ncbi:hypothetical protein [Enterococcus phage vB_EhiS_268]|uniref:Uncharacterized protein n=1 Tax=Enterococcus phage vB_EhiS_268 TaxID=2736817 RepID=A0ACA9AT57_9CAUD|nr:hypothetical protein [Enterococcus phage vB_EhiS_268]
MTKKLTVNDVAHLLDGNGLIEVTFERDEAFYYNIPRYELDEIVTKYGERVVTWITHVPEDGDERMAIQLEGTE